MPDDRVRKEQMIESEKSSITAIRKAAKSFSPSATPNKRSRVNMLFSKRYLHMCFAFSNTLAHSVMFSRSSCTFLRSILVFKNSTCGSDKYTRRFLICIPKKLNLTTPSPILQTLSLHAHFESETGVQEPAKDYHANDRELSFHLSHHQNGSARLLQIQTTTSVHCGFH